MLELSWVSSINKKRNNRLTGSNDSRATQRVISWSWRLAVLCQLTNSTDCQMMFATLKFICWRFNFIEKHIVIMNNYSNVSSSRSITIHFYRTTSMLSAVYAVVMCLCVCLSVCLCVCVCVSVTLRCCIKTAKRRITQIMPHDSPLTLVFWRQRSLRNSKGITPFRISQWTLASEN